MAARGVGVRIIALLAVLASVPWQGVGYFNHVGWHRVPLGNTGIVMVRPMRIPICIHMDWRIRRMIRQAPGAILA